MQKTAQNYQNLNSNLQPSPINLYLQQNQKLFRHPNTSTIQIGNVTQLNQFNRTHIPAVAPLPIHNGSQAKIINHQKSKVVSQKFAVNQKLISGATGAIQEFQVATTKSPVGTTIPPKPTSTSRIQYIPIQRKVVDYETRQIISNIWVPIQRKCLNYYAIQYITEYIPRQVQDVKYEMVPEEYIEYKLQYVPVQRQIVHMPQDQNIVYRQLDSVIGQETHMPNISKELYNNNKFVSEITGQTAKIYAINNGVINKGSINTVTEAGSVNTGIKNNINIAGYQSLPNTRPLPKSNYVTSEGLIPSYSASINYNSFLTGTSGLNNQTSSITTLKTINQQRIPDSFAYDRNFTENNSNLKPISRISQQSKPRLTQNLEQQYSGLYAY